MQNRCHVKLIAKRNVGKKLKKNKFRKNCQSNNIQHSTSCSWTNFNGDKTTNCDPSHTSASSLSVNLKWLGWLYEIEIQLTWLLEKEIFNFLKHCNLQMMLFLLSFIFFFVDMANKQKCIILIILRQNTQIKLIILQKCLRKIYNTE